MTLNSVAAQSVWWKWPGSRLWSPK